MKRWCLCLLLVLLITQAAIPAAAAGRQDTIYVVQPGDTLYKISIKVSVPMALIVSANRIVNPNLVYIGQRLVIPGGSSSSASSSTASSSTAANSTASSYVVRRGDTLFGIAYRFRTTVAALVAANSLANAHWIRVGQRLQIPGAASSTTTAVSPTPVPVVIAPSTGSGGFELGGQVASFSSPNWMRHAGMRWVKQQVRWSPGANANDFAGTINFAHSQGFKVLLSVLGDPGHISGGANYAELATFMGGLAALGADGIEVWNEMNIDREWPAGQISGASYTEMLRQAYNAIKARNANTLVISGAPAPTGAEGAFGLDHVWNDDRFINSMAAAGAARYMDCIGAHYNEGIVAPSVTSGDPRSEYFTRYFWGMLGVYYNAFGGAKPVCFTELGYLTDEGYSSLESTAPAFAWATNVSVAQQAAWLAEAASLARSSGKVRLMIVFNVDLTTYGADPQAGYAIIRPGGSCPACDSLRAVMV